MNEESARMMELARRDLRAAQGMAGDTVAFTDEILPSFLLHKAPGPFLSQLALPCGSPLP